MLDSSFQNDKKLLEPYLQPALKSFISYGGPISDTFLEKLQVPMQYIFRNFKLIKDEIGHNVTVSWTRLASNIFFNAATE